MEIRKPKRKVLKGRSVKPKKEPKKKRVKVVPEQIKIEHVLPKKSRKKKAKKQPPQQEQEKAAETKRILEAKIALASRAFASSIETRRQLLKRKRKSLFSQFYNLSYEYSVLSRNNINIEYRVFEELSKNEDVISAQTRVKNEYVLIKHIESIIRFLESTDSVDKLPSFLRDVNYG